MTHSQGTKRAERRLAVIRDAQEVSGSIAETCRYHGISRECYYKWLHRYEEAEHRVPLFELVSATEEADDLAVFGVRRHDGSPVASPVLMRVLVGR